MSVTLNLLRQPLYLAYGALTGVFLLFLFTPFWDLSVVGTIYLALSYSILRFSKLEFPKSTVAPALRLILVTGLTAFVIFHPLIVFQVPSPFRADHWLTFFSLLVFAPLCEELLFRGAILPALLKNGFSKKLSLFLSSLLFAAVHLNGLLLMPDFKTFIFLQTGCAFFVGLFLGHQWTLSKSLIHTIALHFTFNASFLIFSKIYY